MYVVFLAGGIASGKSTVARELERRGCLRIDLDQLSREVCEPGSAVVAELARTFGDDVADPATGELRRPVLAARAFESHERTQALERIVHPAIRTRLEALLAAPHDECVAVVEVPLLDRVEGWVTLADEVVCVVCPYELRRKRAVERGMDAADFDARAVEQPSDDYLRAHATTLLHNEGDEAALLAQIDAWWQARSSKEWGC